MNTSATATTERPWTVATGRTLSTHNSPTRFWETDIKSSDGYVATANGRTQAEAEANAELIVRSVNSFDDLYAALEALPLDSFGDDMDKCDAADFVDHAGDFFEAMVLARKAMRKARGEQ